MSISNIIIKETYTVAEVVEISGMSISKIRSLIKRGDLTTETVNTTNDTGRKVRRTEIKLEDLVDFGMAHPEYKALHDAACAIKVSTDASFGGIPGAIDENADPRVVNANVEPIEKMDPTDVEVRCKPSVDPADDSCDIPQEDLLNSDPSTELPATEDIFTPEPYSELDVDNAGAFEETASADTESCNLIRSVIEEHIIVLTNNRAALEAKKREIERIIGEIDYKLKRATNALNQTSEHKCAVNCEE